MPLGWILHSQRFKDGVVQDVGFEGRGCAISQASASMMTEILKGKTEAEVKECGRAYKTGQFPFMASGRAKAMENTSGFVKIISSQDDDEILGVHIVGPMAGELISEAVLALEFNASTEDIQRTIHAHPSLAEAVHEAALAVDGKALNFPNR